MKYKYAVNSKNQLLIKSRQDKRATAVNGSFGVDKNNQLIYWLNQPSRWRREYSLPNKIRFTGKWRINSEHNLQLVLNETKDQYSGNRLTLNGRIISIDNNSLVFEIITRNKRVDLSPRKGAQAQTQIRLLKLNGLWKADEYNRLSFMVKKKVSPDTLILEGAWQVNQHQQIIYNFEKINRKTKSKTMNTLVFEGFWQINDRNRLTYILERSWKSRFDFRVQVETPNIYPRQGVIKYRLGIGIRQKRQSRARIISLYGTWKFSRKAGLIFKMNYGKGKLHSIRFGTSINLNTRDKIVFSLTNKRKQPLGLCITFSHRFLKQLDAETFLRLKRILGEETAIETGLNIPF